MGQAKQRGTFDEREAQAIKQNAIIDDYFKKAPCMKRYMLNKFNGNRMTLAAMILVEINLRAKK